MNNILFTNGAIVKKKRTRAANKNQYLQATLDKLNNMMRLHMICFECSDWPARLNLVPPNLIYNSVLSNV